ncbi:hypothetical protein DITRI_Ditri04bG0194700 [Diplodiscus trichospermus]
MDIKQLLDSIRLRVSFWCKAKWPAIHECLLDIYIHPDLVKIPSNPNSLRVGGNWLRPQQGYVKFNVDGSSLGKPGQAAELIAIREAMAIFIVSCWAKTSSLIIESDSRNAINWVLNPKSAPWKWRSIISDIE